MTGGMATIAGTVLVVYTSILSVVVEEPLRHLLVASVISVPAAVSIANLMIPPTLPPSAGVLDDSSRADSFMDAVIGGTQSGLILRLNVAALLVLVAMVRSMNAALACLPSIAGEPVTLQRGVGRLMPPIVWLMGIPWSEAVTAGGLLGTKTVLNEFIAYFELARLEPGALSERSKLIMTYALCGRANFASLGAMLGGLVTLIPERRAELLELGPRAIVFGTLARCCTGAVVGVLTG